MLRHGHDPLVQDWAKNDRYMIVLGVENEQELSHWESELAQMNIPTATFLEPDIDNQRTAMAIHPNTDRSLFKKLKLL